jgi:hypothetical protein
MEPRINFENCRMGSYIVVRVGMYIYLLFMKDQGPGFVHFCIVVD